MSPQEVVTLMTLMFSHHQYPREVTFHTSESNDEYYEWYDDDDDNDDDIMTLLQLMASRTIVV